MELTDKLQEVLRQHLPEMQAKELKEFITQAEGQKKSLLELQTILKAKEDQVAILLKKKEQYDAITFKLAELETATKAAEEKERNLVVAGLKADLSAQREISSNMKEFISLICKNPRAIEIMSHYENLQQQPYSGSGGTMVYPTNINRITEKKTESIETKSGESPPL